MIGVLACLASAAAVSEIGMHKGMAPGSLLNLDFQHAGPMTTEDGKTGKPTVVNGEHLDPYNVPEELIGEVGLAGPKGEPGKKGLDGEPGPAGDNVTSSGVRVSAQAPQDSQAASSSITRFMVVQLFVFNTVCLGIIYFSLRKRIQTVEEVKQAMQAQDVDESYVSLSFSIAFMNFPSLEQNPAHLAAFEELVRETLARAAVAGGAAGVTAENAAAALGEGDNDSTMVSATMSPPDNVTSMQLKQALDKGQFQALMASAASVAPGHESFKKGSIEVQDFESQIETPEPETGAPSQEPDPFIEQSGPVQEL
eukprot:CAMPEP_0181438654 /NCGR_PEP_ID=MMETSP1110-20121109/22021_1 /TAXON_ID=174948 /ORGANISM="Symbiodinium sp., Strain CCMP421" /LENGTH=309 /DNA_ID=CAMNT_0023562349 /DNA_START=73 /DNA_END=1002 /DNA_ORIENTATION=-